MRLVLVEVVDLSLEVGNVLLAGSQLLAQLLESLLLELLDVEVLLGLLALGEAVAAGITAERAGVAAAVEAGTGDHTRSITTQGKHFDWVESREVA